MKWTEENIFWHIALTILCIACFPANPLVLTGLIDTEFYPATFIIGWITWVIGMVLVMAPIVMFPRKGGVARGKSFVHTTRLVNTGIYAIVRHPQYLGGILALFLTTLLWYPHWIFAVLGIIGSTVLYLGMRQEDKRLIRQFGDEYREYIKQVPRMNLIAGIIRLRHQKQS